MRKFVVLALALACIIAAGVLAAQQQSSTAVPPPWAYGFATPPGPAAAPPAAPAAPAAAPAPDPTLHKLPGSTLSFTLAQIRDVKRPAVAVREHPRAP